MPYLPVLTARQVIRILERAGFEKVRQRGSHAHYRNQRTDCRVTVPYILAM